MNLLESVLKKFGFAFNDTQKGDVERKLESIDIEHDVGAYEQISGFSELLGLNINYLSSSTNENELIKTYRSLSITADVERVLNEIRNEIFVFSELNTKAIDISFNDLDKYKISDNIAEKIRNEYDYIYNLLDFQKRGLELFDRWYIDGKIFLHKVVDKEKPEDGIQKIIRIDPLKIRKIIEYPEPNKEGVYDLNAINTYYIFSDTYDVFKKDYNLSRVMIINKDAITHSDSGVYDINSGLALSYLWKMIVPYNNMRMMEDSLIVYRVVRSPERRVFYVNTGNLSKAKSEQYIQELMTRFKNKLAYDTKTGTLSDRKNILSMIEDYWLPRRGDDKGTEIQTLPGASNLGSIDDVELFKKKFYESSEIPPGRFKDDQMGSLIFGRSADIPREEYRFKKFLDRLRSRFILIFDDLLKTQLILKNIIVESDWDTIKNSINWVYAEDNNYVLWKEQEKLSATFENLNGADVFVGKYFTKDWILKKIMKMDDLEIETLKKELGKKKTNNDFSDNENDESELENTEE